MKIDLRVATITAAERVPKTDKLMKLEVRVGEEERTIVSGDRAALYCRRADRPQCYRDRQPESCKTAWDRIPRDAAGRL